MGNRQLQGHAWDEHRQDISAGAPHLYQDLDTLNFACLPYEYSSRCRYTVGTFFPGSIFVQAAGSTTHMGLSFPPEASFERRETPPVQECSRPASLPRRSDHQ